jgi:hypothetical protein
VSNNEQIHNLQNTFESTNVSQSKQVTIERDYLRNFAQPSKNTFTMRSAIFLSTLAMLSAGTHAFAPLSLNHCGSVSNTAIQLLPSQGSQLAAESAAALAKEKEEDDTTTSEIPEEEKATPTNAARELVSRIFNLPSQLIEYPDESSKTNLPFPVSSNARYEMWALPLQP